MTRIYIAAPLALALFANRFAGRAVDRGYEVTSRWHAQLAPLAERGHTLADPRGSTERQAIADACAYEVALADVLVAFTHDGGTPRGTYVEIGMALADGTPVVWTQHVTGLRCVFDGHPLVTRLEAPVGFVEGDVLEAALEVLEGLGREA